jgi:predicted dehydrogenase/threonine dehydrogenase-like Zn-dependent dehydrogenase
MLVEFARKSLLGKARSRPDLVRQTLDKISRDGLLTTLDAVQRRLDQPLPMGYSSAGIIVEVGEGLAGAKVGTRVACAGGGYAVHGEYALVPQNLMTQLPEKVSLEEGAFVTLGAIGMHGFRLADPQVGDRVAIVGLGLLGLLTAMIAESAGCRVFGVDLDPKRVGLANELGLRAVGRETAEEAAAQESEGIGFDHVLICAATKSNDPVTLAGEIARDRANVIAVGAVGMEIPRNVYYQKELRLQVSRSYGPGRYDPSYEEGGQDYPIGFVRWTEGRNLAGVVKLMEGDRLDVTPLITHRFPIERAPEAYELITRGGEELTLGVLLTYPDVPQTEQVLQRKIALQPTPAEPSGEVRLGVLGAGNFASTVMLPALKKLSGIELIGLVSGKGLSGAEAGRRYGFRYTSTEEGQLFDDDQVNTVAVLTRHNLHARQVILGLETGKHVFCEKPLAITREDLRSILEVLETSETLLMVGFNRRFAPLAKELKSFFAPVREPLVMTYRVNAGRLPSSHWLHDPDQGGGRIIGEGCHFIDFLTFLAGAPPVAVTATGLPEDDRYQEDNVLLTLEFQNGSIGSVAYLANGDRAFPKERVEVFAGGRVAVLDNFRKLEMVAKGRRKRVRAPFRQDKGHLGEWEVFCQAIAGGGPPPIPYSHLFGVTEAAISAVQSLRTRERVVVKAYSFDECAP